MSSSVERCFEEAEESGFLQIIHKGLKQFPPCVDDYDLLDVIHLDLSKNRFAELPQEVLSFVMIEKMNCSYNFLRTLPDLSHLTALTVIDVRQNQMQIIPIHLCSLPLKILNASHNKINVIPSELGLLSKLQLLDLSCNELVNLPSTMGDLSSLGCLNLRRNHIVALPDELSKLKKLTKLDISCNKIAAIPPAFRLISSLVELNLTNNPLTSPPAQICIKGRWHMMKYLSLAAQQQEKRWTLMKENGLAPSPSSSSLTGSVSPVEVQQELDTTIEQQSRNRSSTIKNDDSDEMVVISTPNDENESTKSFSTSVETIEPSEKETLPTSPIENIEDLQRTLSPEEEIETVKPKDITKPPPVQEKPKVPRKPTSFNEKHKLTLEKGKLTPQPFKTRLPTPTSPPGRLWSSSSDSGDTPVTPVATMSPVDRIAVRNIGSQLKSNDEDVSRSKTAGERLDDLAARKEQLLKNKEEILKSKQRLELIKSKSHNREQNSINDAPLSPSSVSSQSESEVVFDGISRRNPMKPRTSAKRLAQDGVINFTMRRMFDSAKEEFELLEKLRESIESRLGIKLPDDLPASLSDGIVLCHLVNNLRKGTIPVIHVPSSGVPKLTMPKCQMNVDAFIDACRRAGVEKDEICTAPDILEEKSPTKLCKTVHLLLQVMGEVPPNITLKQTPR